MVLVEKTDRLYRNFRDCVTLEDLGVEIYLPKEGQIIGKNSKSQAKLMHGIQLVIARNFVENLTEEVKKGMREKAGQGIYPARCSKRLIPPASPCDAFRNQNPATDSAEKAEI